MRRCPAFAATVVVSLVPEDDGTAESALRGALALRYNTVKPFLSLLGESRALGAATGGMRILTGGKRLPALSRRKAGEKPLLPREVDDKLVPGHWRKAVYANAELPQGAVDRDAYVVCVLEQLFRALQRRDTFASPSHRWSDPRARLLDRKGWEAVREDVLAGLSLEEDTEEHLRELTEVLDARWKQMAEHLEEAGADAKISIEVQPNGRAKLNVERLHALGEPKSLAWLRSRVEKMLPKIDLPDQLFEVHAWTGFLDAFVHLGNGRTRMKDLTTSPASRPSILTGSRSPTPGKGVVCEPPSGACPRLPTGGSASSSAPRSWRGRGPGLYVNGPGAPCQRHQQLS
ncbi:hypothetical protein OG204_01170 [Streptomyces sp. NBC_01387]